MKEGWIKDYRKEQDSDIWVMPPLYYKVWQFLKYSVCFEQKKIPMRDGSSIFLMPGQFLTSIRTIATAVGWYDRGIWKEPNPKTIQDVLEWLESQSMITIEHGRFSKQYSLITIVNWLSYQGIEDNCNFDIEAESNSKASIEKQPMDINNNDNNYKNDKEQKEEKICAPVVHKNKSSASSNLKDYSDEFESFWSVYPRRLEKKRAYRVWKARLKEKVSSDDMISAAINYSRYCRDKGVDPQYIKHPGTFLGPDKPFEEFIHGMPEIKRTVDIPKNVSNALELCQRVENGEIGEVSLW